MLAIKEIEATCERSQGEVHHSSEQIAETLDQILRSTRFKDSQQLQTLLRYVVEETIKGNDETLKERMIGIYVFGRRPDYDTTEDPIVRSRMGLLRKRLAQYYDGATAEQSPIQIVIPNGTYRPAFVSRPVTKGKRTQSVLGGTKPASVSIPVITNIVPAIETPQHIAPKSDSATAVPSTSRRKLTFQVASIAAVLAIVLVGAWWFFLPPQQQEMDALWAPIIKGKQPVYIYTGTMPVYEPESPADEASSAADLYWPIRVPEPPTADLPKMGPNQVFSYGEGMLTGSVYADIRVSAFLSKYNRTPVMRSGPDLPYMDLKGSPLILIGSFDNYWTRVMNESLPFYFDRGFGIRERAGAHRRWHNPLKAEMTPRMMDDYALVFRVMDSKAGAPVLAIAGLSTCGTHAVADFVTDPVQMKALSGIPRSDLLSKNIELVLHTSLVNCSPTSVQVIASKVW